VIFSLSFRLQNLHDASIPQRLLGIPLLPTASARRPGRHELVAFQDTNLIFVDEYSARSTIDAAAFFCGKGVPLKDALFFYTLCNDHNPLFSTINFILFYRLWETSGFVYPYTFYDVRLKKTRHVGPHRQPDSSLPPDVHVPLGIDATGNGQRIRDKIAQVFGVHAVPGSDR